jgi:hypothetical protein
MTAAQDDRPQPRELDQAIQCGIAQRARVGIQAVKVEVIGARIVISGCVPSYYVKQLVLEGVLDVVGPAGTNGIEFNIHVAANAPQSVEQTD